MVLHQNKSGFFLRIQNFCKAQAFDFVAESLSSDGYANISSTTTTKEHCQLLWVPTLGTRGTPLTSLPP